MELNYYGVYANCEQRRVMSVEFEQILETIRGGLCPVCGKSLTEESKPTLLKPLPELNPVADSVTLSSVLQMQLVFDPVVDVKSEPSN